jgi:hypothetical protein
LLKAKPWLETAPELEAKALFEHFLAEDPSLSERTRRHRVGQWHLKRRLKNHLALCGSGDFASEAAYPAFFVEEPVAMKPGEAVIRAQRRPLSNEDSH